MSWTHCHEWQKSQFPVFSAFVKTVRLCFLLLLAVLLPLRGAVAAAMLCSAGDAGSHNELRMAEGSSEANAGMAHHVVHEAGPSDARADAEHAHGEQRHHHAGSDKCNMCSACCSLTPLVSAVPVLAEPLGFTAVRFASYTAPLPSFFSGGQERPPRTT
ncbi:hypothetical protein LRH25_30855 [Ideonella azotifigens]|uniref:DUF2946 domain-containing protein n=1 Tax=Ideonella azotifigens TaxID=513160 RepID=A0ABN1JI70_9BURK|nr:DUF2946 family protein [Ideonella azotifigens]MCD2344724.1 hypothetical protein [Ideonella azotifigens]